MAKLRVDKIAAPIVQDEFTGSVFFDGNGDHLDVPLSSDFNFGAGDFTIEAWVYIHTAKDAGVFGTNKSSGSFAGYELDVFTNGSIRFYSGNGSTYNYTSLGASTAAGSVPVQTWTHIVASRQESTLRLFVNGVLSGSNTSFTHTIADSPTAPDIGSDGISTGSTYHHHGYISNLRVCKGHAVYTGNFTVPTRELEVHTKPPKGVVFPAADNVTVLLACQDANNPLTDSSGRHTITGAGHLSGDFGKNIVTNGDFTDGTTGWTGLSGATLSVENGKLKITEATGAADGYAVNGTAITTVVGVTYKIEWTFTEGTNTSFQVRFGNSGDQTQEYQSNSAAGGTFNDGGTYSFYFIATGTQLNLSFIVNQASTYGYVSNVSVVAVAPISEANPGLFRKTNITSTITETTGSVYFDGTGDYLEVKENGNDFDFDGDTTIETWIYFNTVPTNSWVDFLGSSNNSAYLGSGKSGWIAAYYTLNVTGLQFRLSYQNSNSWTFELGWNFTATAGNWYHVAYTRENGTIYCYVNGVKLARSTTSGTEAASIVTSEGFLRIGGGHGSTAKLLDGYISNVRICKGHAVYKKRFSLPTRELEVHGGPDDDRTVLLACYDGENIFADKSGRHIIAAYGDRLSSPTPTATDSPIGSTTVTPGLTRNVDPVDGPTFQGGVGFVSQNWLTLPKGTTTERMPVLGGVNATSARGVFGGGYSTSDIEYIQISTLGNSSEFGDRAYANFARPASLSSSTRGLFAGGFTSPSYTNAIDYITISSTGDGKDFGDMSIAVWSRAGCSNSIRGILAGGFASSNFNVIEHLTIATTGNTQDFGDLTRSRREKGGSSSTTRGIFMGGRSPVPSGVNNDEDIIDYITIASTGNAVDFGNLAADRSAGASCSNATRSLFSGGNSSNAIEFVTIATLGNALDFGDMSNALNRLGSCASSTRGIIAGGSPTNDTIEYVTIATAGDALDFGDLNAGAKRDIAGLSNGHGGLG